MSERVPKFVDPLSYWGERIEKPRMTTAMIYDPEQQKHVEQQVEVKEIELPSFPQICGVCYGDLLNHYPSPHTHEPDGKEKLLKKLLATDDKI